MLKRILFTITTIFSLFTIALYSQNAFELAVYGNGGINFSFPSIYNAEFLRTNQITNIPFQDVESYPDTGVGFGFFGSLQLGYYMDFYKEISGLSILLDGSLAYVRSSFSSSFIGSNTTTTSIYNDVVIYQSDAFTINAGILVKMHILKNFAFGIGGGIKLALLNENIMLSLDTPRVEEIKKHTYTEKPISIISPYGKVTVEYLLFLTGSFSIRMGIYGDIDIGQLFLGEDPRGKTMLASVGASLGFGHLFRFY